MLLIGIVLLLVGALVAALAPDYTLKRIGYFVAAVGVILLVVALILLLVDDTNGRHHDLALLPLLAWRARGLALR